MCVVGIKHTYYLTISVNTCDDGSRAYVRRTKARGPSSRVRPAWDRLMKELKNLLKQKCQTPGVLLMPRLPVGVKLRSRARRDK